jgi:hypothetical protein
LSFLFLAQENKRRINRKREKERKKEKKESTEIDPIERKEFDILPLLKSIARSWVHIKLRGRLF